ncbi:MAG: hypothetical protein ABIS48_00345 [Candidatus Saccharimonadales bacterium]
MGRHEDFEPHSDSAEDEAEAFLSLSVTGLHKAITHNVVPGTNPPIPTHQSDPESVQSKPKQIWD